MRQACILFPRSAYFWESGACKRAFGRPHYDRNLPIKISGLAWQNPSCIGWYPVRYLGKYLIYPNLPIKNQGTFFRILHSHAKLQGTPADAMVGTVDEFAPAKPVLHGWFGRLFSLRGYVYRWTISYVNFKHDESIKWTQKISLQWKIHRCTNTMIGKLRVLYFFLGRPFSNWSSLPSLNGHLELFHVVFWHGKPRFSIRGQYSQSFPMIDSYWLTMTYW